MKKVIVLLLSVVTLNSYADWLYNKSSNKLTECDANGVVLSESPWSFTVTVKSSAADCQSISIWKSTAGASTSINLQAPIHGDKAIIIEIGLDTFNYNFVKKYIKEVKLPLELTSIGYNAFYGQSELVHVEPFLPEGVNYLGQGSFQNCAITNALRLGYGDGTVSVGNYAFQGNDLPSVDAGPGVYVFPQSTFYNCDKLGSVKLSDSFKTFGPSAFYGCSALTNITPFLPDSVTSIGAQSLHVAKNLTGTFSFIANNHPASINADCISLTGVTNICFGNGDIFIADNALTTVQNVKTVKFGKGVLRLSSYGMQGFRVNSYATRFDIPAGITAWGEFVSTNKVMDWADVPATGANPSKEKYYEVFPDGPEPQCLIWLYGYGSHSKYIWARFYKLGADNAKSLYVRSILDSGEEVTFVTTSPSGGEYADVSDSLPMVCTAPEYINNGALTEYKCAGYMLETMDNNYQWVKTAEVLDGTCTYTFNPQSAGITRLTWVWEPYAYNISLHLPQRDGFGSIQMPDKDHGDFYLKDRLITISATGDKFQRWFGSVPEDQIYNRTITIKMDSEKWISPYYSYDWVRKDKFIEDGYWKLPISVSSTKVTVTGITTSYQSGFMDLSKPIQSGEIIVEIGQNAFKDNKVLTELRLPDTIVKLNSSSLYNCVNLKSVTPLVPKSLVTFNDWCLRACAITNDLIIGENLESAYSFGSYAFSECGNITRIIVKEGLKTIKAHTFSYLYGLRVLKFEGDYPTIIETGFTRGGIAKFSKKVQLYLPKDRAGWKDLIDACVTPWNEVSDADKQIYYDTFGESAPKPDGLFVESKKAKCLGQIGDQWYFGYSTTPGLIMIVR